jgi:S-adenosylmethionine hydrolase
MRKPHHRSPAPLLTLLTDFGTRDYYVAAVKGTVLRLAPGSQVVDLSHDLDAGDVAAAAFLLAAAAPCFPAATLHLAVVDPGVGSERRILAVEAASGRFLAPDNGLLTPFFAGGTTRRVERPDLYLPGPGATFHGRDRFAPVAAFLLAGGSVQDLGPVVADPHLLPVEPPRREPGRLAGRVVHVDRFGNLVTDIPSAWLPDGPVEARAAGRTVRRRVGHYSLLAPGEAALVPGSLGTLELSANGEDLARRWGVGRGAGVEIVLGPARPPVTET